MRPIDWQGANTTLGAPPSNEHNVSAMRVFRNGMVCVSCWEVTPEDIADFQRTGKLYLSVFSGHTQPPVMLGDEDTTREVVADLGGVWKR